MIRSLILLACFASLLLGQSASTLKVRAVLDSNGDDLHNVTVRVLELNRALGTDEDGVATFTDVPPGKYTVLAHLHALADETKRVEVAAGQAAEVTFRMRLTTLRQEVNVTASGTEQLVFDTIGAATTVSGYSLTTKAQAPALGEMLEDQTGITKRSYGPGASRPVIRGLDGDRVLVLQDGARTGTLSSQSGDHGEPFDPLSVERIEIVRGPQTLLYGTNAIGGVVNVISAHDDLTQAAHKGLHGYVSAVFGSNNNMAGGSGGFEFGTGRLQLWGGGGGQRTESYKTPLGEVENSQTEHRDGRVGIGSFGGRIGGSVVFSHQEGSYGVPPLEEPSEHSDDFKGRPIKAGGEGEELVTLPFTRQFLRTNFNVRDLGKFENLNILFNASDWSHRELEGEEIGTRFNNRQYSGQTILRQKRAGLLSGSLGFFALGRQFKATGEEALSPPVDQRTFAGFAVEELNFERFKVQFGGRVERNSYSPDGLRNRSFTGFSGSVGGSYKFTDSLSGYASYGRSYRAPALEELYFNGPHFGTLAFEIGDDNLRAETANSFEGGIRLRNGKWRGEFNTFFYRFGDFVYLQRTGAEEEGLLVANYRQADTRYYGAEYKLEYMASNWLTVGNQLDVVRASLIDSDELLPRIPPLRSRVWAEGRWKQLLVRPELVLANRQDRVAFFETPTAGFAVWNLNAFYNLPTKHAMHTFNFTLFNAGDRLYRNHVNLIKDFAPEIGRGVRFSYTLNFF